MPRGNEMPESLGLFHGLIMGLEKVGKSDWAMRAALAGYNVLYLDGDVASGTLNKLAKEHPEAASRIFYCNVGDAIVDGQYKTNMIDFFGEFFTQVKLLWDDTNQSLYSRANSAESEVWEIYPSRLDHRWVVVIDSWTTLSYSAMVAKAIDLGVEIADVEKVSREIYAGVGNRLTSILATIQRMPCHVVVIGHPDEYAKTKSPDGVKVKEVKEIDRITEWTRMIPKSSSKPHGLTMGKFFTDVGWISLKYGQQRVLDFTINVERSSGGSLNSKGDPRGDHSFGSLVGAVASSAELGRGMVIHPVGTYQPPTAKSLALPPKTLDGTKAPQPMKGLGGLSGLKAKPRE